MRSSRILRMVSLIGCGIVCVNLGSVSAQPVPVKQVQKNLKKVTKQVEKGTRQATKQVKTIAKAAVTNLPTPEWNKLQSAYEYPSEGAQIEEFPKPHPSAMMLKIRFMGANNKPVEGVFLRPKAEGTYPCALLLHGLTNNKEIAIKMFGDKLLAHNIAILALDAPEHGAQRNPHKNMWSQKLVAYAVREGDRNYRKALDWLTQRSDVDASRIGLIGYSMGSIMGSILGAVDDRVSAFALCVGGDPLRILARVTPVAQRESLTYASPSLYIEHITPRPIVFFNGTQDVVISQPAAKLLHNAAKDPKQVVWYNGGHDIPAKILKQAADWMATKLAADQSTGGAEAPPK